MSFSYDVSTTVGKIRLWIQDSDSNNALFSDEDINAMLSMNDNDIRATAAALLFALASNKSLLAKAVSAGKYSEDNRSAAKELRETAQAILNGGNTPWDSVIEQTFESPLDQMRPFDSAGAKEFINKEYLRGESI